MEKLIYLLWKADDLNHEQFREKLIECAPLMQNKGIQQFKFNHTTGVDVGPFLPPRDLIY